MRLPHNFYTQSSGTPISASKAASSDEVEYYNPDDATSSWAVKEYVETEGEGEEEEDCGAHAEVRLLYVACLGRKLTKVPVLFILSLPTAARRLCRRIST